MIFTVGECVPIYRGLFAIGKLLLLETGLGILLVVIGLAAGAVFYWDLSRCGWSSVVE